MPAETNPLAISKGSARANFSRALSIALGNTSVPEEWLQRTSRIGEARNRTYTPVLGTILLAKATNPNISAFALKTGGVTRGYSPRSLAKDVFVPLCMESRIDIRTHGAEPFNNQPFFGKNEIRREMAPVSSLDRPDLDFLVDSVERADRLSPEQAIIALAAYLRVRLAVGQRAVLSLPSAANLTLRDVEHAATMLLRSSSDAGRRGKALMASFLDLVFPSRVFDSGRHPATRALGDLVVATTSEPGDQTGITLVAAVRTRPVSASEVVQLAQQATERGVGKALLLALSPRQSTIDVTDGSTEAAERHQVTFEVYTDFHALAKAAIIWSSAPIQECLSRLPTLVAQRLKEFRCDDTAQEEWRTALDAAAGPRAQQATLPLFGP